MTSSASLQRPGFSVVTANDGREEAVFTTVIRLALGPDTGNGPQ